MGTTQTKLADALYEFGVDGAPNGPRWRVEQGPKTKTAIATEELLSDAKTATHYQVGERDAVGKIIVLGEPMTYHDWLPGGDRIWKVYKWVKDDKHPQGGRFEHAGHFDDQVEAINAAYNGLNEELAALAEAAAQ